MCLSVCHWKHLCHLSFNTLFYLLSLQLSTPQERGHSNASSATSPPPRSPTYHATNVFTLERSLTAAPGATTGTGSLTLPWLQALMVATMAMMIRRFMGGGGVHMSVRICVSDIEIAGGNEGEFEGLGVVALVLEALMRGRGGRQTGLISTARLHLITLPSSTGPARSPHHTHIHTLSLSRTQCHCHWQVPVIKTPSYHISNYTGNCRWNWKSFGWRCTSPSLSLSLPPLVSVCVFLSSCASSSGCGRRVWKGMISNPSLVLDVLFIRFSPSVTKSFQQLATPAPLQWSAQLISSVFCMVSNLEKMKCWEVIIVVTLLFCIYHRIISLVPKVIIKDQLVQCC